MTTNDMTLTAAASVPSNQRLLSAQATPSTSEAGNSTHTVALKCNVSKAWVRRLKQRRRESGEVAARRPVKKTPPKWHAYADRLIRLVEEQPDITL